MFTALIYKLSKEACWHDLCLSVAMLQTDLTTGMQRRIKRDHGIKRRWDKRCISSTARSVWFLVKWKWKWNSLSFSCSCFSSAPVFWDRMDASAAYQVWTRLKRNWICKENFYQNRSKKFTYIQMSYNLFYSRLCSLNYLFHIFPKANIK